MKKILYLIVVILVIIGFSFYTTISAQSSIQKINASEFTKIGNMTGGVGLNGLFDGLVNNSYYQGTVGWGGVYFPNPQKVTSVQIDSQTNGFDASGISSQISLILYGRIYGAPSSSTDGIQISDTITFTDLEYLNTKTLSVKNEYLNTEFNYIWVTIQTGVWASATEIRLYYDDQSFTNTPTPSVTSTQASSVLVISEPTILENPLDVQTGLLRFASEIPQYRMEFYLQNDSTVEMQYDGAFEHGYVTSGYSGVVGIGMRIQYRFSETYIGLNSENWISPKNSVTGSNISDITQHYCVLSMHDFYQLEGGYYYQFRIIGSAHSTGSNSNNLAYILAESGNGLNNYSLEFKPVTILIEY